MTGKNVPGKVTPSTLAVALGIIYGDIGTSPLYVLKAIAGEHALTGTLIYGGVSCVFWTLTLQTTLKYIWLTLKADNHGEGGIFSLYALVRRYGRHLVIPTILGATALLADGIITPPISVASAVEGLTNIEGLENLQTVPIVIGILSVLFFFQRFGTWKVGTTFGPAMVLWFSMLFVLGLLQIVRHPGILAAVNPMYAIRFLVDYPGGFWLLGAVFLATTGAEALYSDLGHCGRRNIRITWAFVKVALLTNYMGQAAWMMQQGPGATLVGRNPFFEIMPHWFLLPGIIVATAATIIASQAMISGSYTLVNEAMNLNFWPRITVRQPTDLKGQIYIPGVNTILWIGCILMVLYFRSSAHMEAAYGFSISIAMMMTTFLLAHYLYYRLKWNRFAVFALLALFTVVEISFFAANVVKIRERWMFLFFELFIFMVMYTCYYARKIHNRLTRFTDLGRHVPAILELSSDLSVPKFATHLVYLTKANLRHEIEEKIIRSILLRKPKRADVYWFLHINRTTEPFTMTYNTMELVEKKIIKVNINLGFRVQPRTELFFKQILQTLVANGEMGLRETEETGSRYRLESDFRFVVLERYLSVENQLSMRESLLLNLFFLLKRMGPTDEKAFGLDRSDVEVEYVPLVYHQAPGTLLERETGLYPNL